MKILGQGDKELAAETIPSLENLLTLGGSNEQRKAFTDALGVTDPRKPWATTETETPLEIFDSSKVFSYHVADPITKVVSTYETDQISLADRLSKFKVS